MDLEAGKKSAAEKKAARDVYAEVCGVVAWSGGAGRNTTLRLRLRLVHVGIRVNNKSGSQQVRPGY